MTEQLRTIAEAEAKNEFHPDRQPFNLYDARRLGYVRGFIAGRTSVTRESIAEIIYANTEQIDYCGYGLMVVDDPLELSDAVLALIRGEVAV